MLKQSVLSASFVLGVALMYLMTRFNFPQSSLSGPFTRVHRKATAVYRSRLTLKEANKSLAMT